MAYDPQYYKDNKETFKTNNERWRADNSEADKKRKREYYQENRDTILDKWYQKTYGITVAQIEEMNKAQNGLCAICGEKQLTRPFKLVIDHCHETMKIRGLLCSLCNRALGLMRDRPELLRKAADYLEGASIVIPSEDSSDSSSQ